MGREEVLWDDSALISAFNDAMSTYKIMHGLGGNVISSQGGRVPTSGEENLSTPDDQINVASLENKNEASDIKTEIGETVDFSPIKENQHLESGDPAEARSSLGAQNYQDEQSGLLNSQSSEEYYRLLSKYYELEDQRQKVLQELNQFYWNDQNSSAATAWNYQTTTSMCPEHQAYATQASYPTLTCSCCPCGCQISVVPCQLPACGLCAAGDKNFSSNVEVKEKELESDIDHTALSSSDEIAFNEAMDAWYKAGFYTAMYWSKKQMPPR